MRLLSMRTITLLIFALCCSLSLSAQKQNVEIIWVLPADSDSIMVYYHVNTHFPGIERKIEAYPDHGILYLCPNEVRLDSLNKSMNIDGGEFSLVEIKSKKALVSQTPEGLSHFKNQSPVEIENDFDLASFMWILPENSKLKEYHSSSEGTFTRHKNILLFTAKKVNHLSFDILYREGDGGDGKYGEAGSVTNAPAETAETESTPAALAEYPDGTMEFPYGTGPSPDTLYQAGIQFESGKWELDSASGEALRAVADQIQKKLVEQTKPQTKPQAVLQTRLKILVAGHADPHPFKPGSRGNNWELSAKRASVVVNRLIQLGIPAEQISASFHSHTRIHERKAVIYVLADNPSNTKK